MDHRVVVGTESNVAGASQYPGPGELPVSQKGAIPMTGGTRTYQAWYRNAQDYCTASTFNLTNGVSIVWLPQAWMDLSTPADGSGPRR